MNIAVFGLGYVGVVSAVCLADNGHRISGVDINEQKVSLLNDGKSPVIEPNLTEKLERVMKEGQLIATTNAKDALSRSDVSFIVVATPSSLTGAVDPTHLYRACQQIADLLVELDRKQVIVIRSTILPKIYADCAAIFEERAPGLVDLGTNPEFLREGSAIVDFENPPFTLLGTCSQRTERALREIYTQVKAPIIILDPAEALMVKYASNVFHGLKVAFANEISSICKMEGIDIININQQLK